MLLNFLKENKMNKYNYAFDVPCGDELECHELLPGEFQAHPVEDEEDLEWLDKVLYTSHPTEGLVMPDLEELELRVIYAMTKKSITELAKVTETRKWSPANATAIDKFIAAMIDTPLEFDALEVINSSIRTFTAGLRRSALLASTVRASAYARRIPA
jgi:hypothetical protein